MSKEGQNSLVVGNAGCGKEACGAMPKMRLAHHWKRFPGAIHEIGTVPTVDVEIDEPRGKKPSRKVDTRYVGKPA